MSRGRAGIRGRDLELADLRTTLAAESGCLVVVRGPAGLGRSAVLDAMAQELLANGVRVLRLDSHHERRHEDTYGIAPLVRAVRAEFEDFGDQRLADSLGAIVRLRDWAVRDGNGWTPQLVIELRLLFDRIADRGRTTILLDDAQLLAEPAPLLVAGRAAGCRVLASIQDHADRSAGVVELLSVADRVMTLGPLADPDMVDLVRQAGGAKLDDAVLDGLRTALGPLFANPATTLDTLADLRTRGHLVPVHGRSCLAVPPSDIGLPADHQLLRQAESLGELGSRLLFAFSVLDEATVDTLPLIAVALRATISDCGRVFDALVDRGVLVVGAGGRVRCRCPALAVTAASASGNAEAAVRLNAGIAEQLLAARRQGHSVLPVPLADCLAGSGTSVSIEPDVRGWLLDLAAAAEQDAPESAARWCAAALRHLPPTGADYADALRRLVGLVPRTGQYALLDEVLARFAQRGGPPEAMADLRTAAALVALHTGEEPVDEQVRRLLDQTFVDEGDSTFAEWWFGRPPAEPPSPSRRLRVSDVDGSRHPPYDGVFGAYHRVTRGYAGADWSAAMSAARELELTGSRNTFAHHAARLYAAEICCARGRLASARRWLADAAPHPRLAALRAWVEAGLFEAADRPAEAVALTRSVCAELGAAGPRIALDRLLMRGLRIASASKDTEGLRALVAALGRQRRAGAGGTIMELVFAGRGIARRDAVYLRVAADLARARGDRPRLLEACLGLARFVDDPRPWLSEAYEIAGQCGASGLLGRVRRLRQELGVSVPRPREHREDLHPTESRIVQLIQDGLTNRQIALELGVSEKTVENRLTRLFARTGYRSRVELAAAGLEGRLGVSPQTGRSNMVTNAVFSISEIDWTEGSGPGSV
jgi:DNA-binding CsgD family transcriptional regulator